jgi:hypothetical protein
MTPHSGFFQVLWGSITGLGKVSVYKPALWNQARQEVR